ncbi:hypothetical protein BIW11_05244, partial [Tropilaelaps mercedesae]
MSDSEGSDLSENRSAHGSENEGSDDEASTSRTQGKKCSR